MPLAKPGQEASPHASAAAKSASENPDGGTPAATQQKDSHGLLWPAGRKRLQTYTNVAVPAGGNDVTVQKVSKTSLYSHKPVNSNNTTVSPSGVTLFRIPKPTIYVGEASKPASISPMTPLGPPSALPNTVQSAKTRAQEPLLEELDDSDMPGPSETDAGHKSLQEAHIGCDAQPVLRGPGSPSPCSTNTSQAVDVSNSRESLSAAVTRSASTSGTRNDSSHCIWCARFNLDCAPESVQCVDSQKERGCHACSRLGCWTSSKTCQYHLRGRPRVADAPTDGTVAPNIFHRRAVTIEKKAFSVTVEIDNHTFLKGSADGGGCNCLIHALQQCISEHVPIVADCHEDREWIREELCNRFPAPGPNAVSPNLYLDLRPHWAAIVELLAIGAQGMQLDPEHLIRPENFRITCVAEQQQIVGDEVGSGHIHLYILNEEFRHFVPLLRRR